MKAEYDKVLKDAGHLGRGYILDNGDLVAYYGACKFVWRFYENDIDCEVVEEKDCWISVINNIDANKSFQKILGERLGIEIHSLSYLHGQSGTYTDIIEIWYR